MAVKGRILITGASGLVGRDCMQHYAELGYEVTAVSRKAPFQKYGANFISVDLSDSAACEEALTPLTDIVQIVFAALHEEPDLVAGWQAKKHIDRNGLMLRNTVEAVLKGAKGLKNISILQGPKGMFLIISSVRFLRVDGSYQLMACMFIPFDQAREKTATRTVPFQISTGSKKII